MTGEYTYDSNSSTGHVYFGAGLKKLLGGSSGYLPRFRDNDSKITEVSALNLQFVSYKGAVLS